ncbi:ATP-binding protein [Thioclava sp. FR2]|uniref:hybrid sensor histidine kinase/response regulator n=1 Tax=Thioclava sp. FR2 TaxID=3445780 RepID=UPI003EBBAB7D
MALGVGGILAFSIWNKLDEIETARQDQRGWVYSQLEVEYLKLTDALHRVMFGETNDLAPLRTRFDVFYSRVKLAETMHINADDENEGIPRLLEMLEGYVLAIDGSDEDLRAAIEPLANSLEEMRNVPREVAIASIAIHAERSEAQRAQVSLYIKTLVYIVILVAFFLLSAIYVLSKRSQSLRIATQRATENEARLDTMLRVSLDAVLMIDDFGTIVDLNGSAEKIFARPRDELLGSSMPHTLVPHRLRAQFVSHLEKFRTTGVSSIADKGPIEFPMIDANGHEFPAEIVASLIPTQEHNLFVVYFRDITERKEKEEELLRMRDEALSAYREKSRFFAMMSHEMRTPLNGVIAALELLDGSKLTPDQRKYVAAAMSSGDVLMGHINDVLAIERAESEEGLLIAPVDLVAMMGTMVAAMQPFADSTQVRLHLDRNGLCNDLVLTDPRSLQQIISNLLSNAIKFSPGGDVTLRAQCAPSELPGSHPGDLMLRLQVIDTGKGISEVDRERIFEDFVSLDSRYERRTGGTGLGLGIVKRMVARLHGTITCDSELGKGTTFTVRIPMRGTTEAEPSTQQALPEATDQRGMDLLVVDDNALNRDLLSEMLEQMGHRVCVAPGGREAIETAAQAPFDAILMDISMPEVNGIQATRAIRGGEGPNRLTPVIAVTAHAMPQERAEFFDAGMEGFVEKPVRRKTLAEALREITPRASGEAKSAPTAEDVEDGSTEDDDTDDAISTDQISELLDLLGLEKTRAQVASFLKTAQSEIEGIASATERDDLRARSHALAGTSGMMGATALSQKCREIQSACDSGQVQAAIALRRELAALYAPLPALYEELLAD